MALPEFNHNGDLPEGVHRETINQVVARFGSTTKQRQEVTERLLRVHNLAQTTGKVERFVIFGSYVTAAPEPNDVDIVIIMRNDFDVQVCDARTAAVFNHERADRELGASVFWVRPALLIEPLEEFIIFWQQKRDNTRRGIVEVTE